MATLTEPGTGAGKADRKTGTLVRNGSHAGDYLAPTDYTDTTGQVYIDLLVLKTRAETTTLHSESRPARPVLRFRMTTELSWPSVSLNS